MRLPGQESVGSPPPHRGLVLAAASLGFAVIQLDVSVVNVAIKPIGTALGGGVSGLQWVVDAYTLTFAALILAAGALGDRSGAKRLLLGGFAVFTLASVACGLVTTIGLLIVPAMTSAMLGSVDRAWSGIASGTLTAFRQTGSVLGVALFGSLLAWMGATAGLHTACALAVGLMLVVAVLLCMAR